MTAARALLALALLAAALPATAGGLVPAPAPTPPTGEACTTTCHVHMMSVGAAFVFDPPLVVASPGSTITFHSHDSLHTATSGVTTETEAVEGSAPGLANLNAFHTGFLSAGASADVTLGGKGAYAYYCAVGFHRHLGMHGAVVVA